MHGNMGGYYELEDAEERALTARGLRGPAIAVITGMRKKTGTVFSDRDYAKVRRLGSEHVAQTPRRVAS
jgi:hypothetical protein